MTSNPQGRHSGDQHRRTFFTAFADRIAFLTGRPSAFFSAAFLILVWLAAGPYFQYSMAWQMTGGVGPTLITFLMVFLIQHLQSRDTKALHIKLDELIRATEGAHTSIAGIHQMTEAQLAELSERYKMIGEQAKEAVLGGGDDTGVTEVEVSVVDVIDVEKKKAKED